MKSFIIFALAVIGPLALTPSSRVSLSGFARGEQTEELLERKIVELEEKARTLDKEINGLILGMDYTTRIVQGSRTHNNRQIEKIIKIIFSNTTLCDLCYLEKHNIFIYEGSLRIIDHMIKLNAVLN